MNRSRQMLYVIYGDNPYEMINQVLSEIKIEDLIDRNARIGIKPNLVVAKPAVPAQLPRRNLRGSDHILRIMDLITSLF